MGRITLDSVKLPNMLVDFMEKVPEDKLVSFSVKIVAFVNEPEHKIPMGGYFDKCALVKPKLIKNIACYTCERMLTKNKNKGVIRLKQLYKSINDEATNKGLASITATVKAAEFLIHNKTYRFVYHPPAKAIVLKYINKKPIGKLKLVQVEALTCKEGDLSFAAPSHCTKVYKEVWECK